MSGRYKFGAKNIHFSVEPVVNNKIVRHSDSMWFHGMTLAIVVIADLWIVEIGYSPLDCPPTACSTSCAHGELRQAVTMKSLTFADTRKEEILADLTTFMIGISIETQSKLPRLCTFGTVTG